MKRAAKIISIVLTIWATLCYTTGAFYEVSFNIAQWTEDTRLAVCVAFGIGLMFVVLPIASLSDNYSND